MSDAQIAGQPPSDKPSMFTKLAYGFGSVAYGVKENGFSYFVLMFYGLVLGVDARLVGLALFIALCFDAISDPIVGYISDNFRSKWGRRHPFMYASAIPVALSFFLLWNPPKWSDFNLFLYLTVLSILIRTFVTLYETPSSSLAPELTRDYDQRTSLMSYRYFFGWAGGNIMSVVMFGMLLVATAEYADGRFNLDGYRTYGIMGSIMIFVAILVSAVGTHSRIKHLQPPPERRKLTLKQVFLEIFETLANKSFMALILATVFAAVASGVSASLAFTVLTFFWQFSSEQIYIWTIFVFISAVIGLVLAPLASKHLGKKRGTIILGALAFSISPLPIILRLFGLMPENGDPVLFPLMLVLNTLDLGLIIAMQALFASMIADLVEQNELKTKRRSEGVFFAAITFTRKCTQGIGVLLAGFVLSLARFPAQTSPQDTPPEALFRLGLLYAPTLWVLWALMILCISFYRIDRKTHETNLEQLARGGGLNEQPAE